MKRRIYNFASWINCQFINIPLFKDFFLHVYDLGFKNYYNLEKYSREDPWLFGSDFQQNRINTLIDFISDREYKKCLDIGCSNGYITNLLAPFCRQITGIDISTKAIEQAQNRYKKGNIKFIAGSIRTYTPSSSYDLIVLGDMLYCLSQNLPEKIYSSVIDRLCSHVEKNGRIIMTSYLPRSPKSGKFILGYSRLYNKTFKDRGFVIEKKKVISGTMHGKTFKDRVVLLSKSK